MRPVSPVRTLSPARWFTGFVLAVSTLALFEVGLGVQLLTEQTGHEAAVQPCQAAQLRASLASDGGYASEEDATVGLTNEWSQVCEVDGYVSITALTLTHHPFPYSVSDYHGDGQGPGIWPLPKPIVLHRGMGAYFLMDWADLEEWSTAGCVNSIYAQVHLAGQHRPAGPPLLVYGPVCAPRGKGQGVVSAFFHCSVAQLHLSPVRLYPARHPTIVWRLGNKAMKAGTRPLRPSAAYSWVAKWLQAGCLPLRSPPTRQAKDLVTRGVGGGT